MHDIVITTFPDLDKARRGLDDLEAARVRRERRKAAGEETLVNRLAGLKQKVAGRG